jgi:hypothetical protein
VAFSELLRVRLVSLMALLSPRMLMPLLLLLLLHQHLLQDLPQAD